MLKVKVTKAYYVAADNLSSRKTEALALSSESSRMVPALVLTLLETEISRWVSAEQASATACAVELTLMFRRAIAEAFLTRHASRAA